MLLSKSEGLKQTAGSLLRHSLPGFSRRERAPAAVEAAAPAPKKATKRAPKAKTAKKKATAK